MVTALQYQATGLHTRATTTAAASESGRRKYISHLVLHDEESCRHACSATGHHLGLKSSRSIKDLRSYRAILEFCDSVTD